MSNRIVAHVFVEDQAHEAFLLPMLRRIAGEENVLLDPRVRTGRGGHSRALDELKFYQVTTRKDISGIDLPDVLVAGIDGNCSKPLKARKAIQEVVGVPFSDRLVIACPDPHIERWYMADPESFKKVVGTQPRLSKKKCLKDYYKDLLASTVRQAGHPSPLGGIDFARDLVEGMDLYRAGRNEHSLKAFIDDVRSKLRILR